MASRLKPDFKAAWVAALRSGEYPQTRGRLRDRQGYCCIGVACDVALKMGMLNKLSRWHEIDNEIQEFNNGFISGVGMPPPDVSDAFFVNDGYNFVSSRGTLDAMNDRGASFEEIADIIEREF
jgi:hypothetical protein